MQRSTNAPNDRTRRRLTVGSAATALALAAGTASAQVWVVNGADLDGRAESLADRGGAPLNPIDDKSGATPLVPGLLGADLGQFVHTRAKLASFTCPLRGSA